MSDQTFLEPPAARSTDSLPVRTASPDLIDLDKVATHIERATGRGRYRGTTDPMEYLLAKKCLIQVGAEIYATLAGILSFGHEPQAVFPRAVVDIGHYRGTETLSHEVVNLEKNIGGTIFDQLARIETYLWANTYHGMTLSETSYQRVELHEYPQAVIRELGVNMIAHRDYANYLSSCQVQKFRNRIAWISPGGLPPGMTVENILSAQASRNPVILDILYEAGYVEAFGQGLDTVVRVLAEEELTPPHFQDTGVSFIVTVYGRPVETIQRQNDTYGLLTDAQRMILTLIRGKGEAPPRDIRALFADRAERSIQRDIKVLLDANLIVAIGGSRSMRYRIRENGDRE